LRQISVPVSCAPLHPDFQRGHTEAGTMEKFLKDHQKIQNLPQTDAPGISLPAASAGPVLGQQEPRDSPAHEKKSLRPITNFLKLILQRHCGICWKCRSRSTRGRSGASRHEPPCQSSTSQGAAASTRLSAIGRFTERRTGVTGPRMGVSFLRGYTLLCFWITKEKVS
jgi:hypothetical protein